MIKASDLNKLILNPTVSDAEFRKIIANAAGANAGWCVEMHREGVRSDLFSTFYGIFRRSADVTIE